MTRDHGVRVPAEGTPECILTWVRKPDGGVRLYASRSLHSTGWGQHTGDSGPTRWLFDTAMDNVLIVDRDTPGQAIAWVLERWAREDEQAEYERRRRLDAHARAGMIISDPKALIQGLPPL